MARARVATAVATILLLAPTAGARAGLAPFGATASPVSAAALGRSYRPGCPVAPAQLRLVRIRYVGFDGRSHLGAIVVNATAVAAVEGVFGRLYGARFPLRRIQPVAAFGGSDDRSMAADNTSGFNCRPAVSPGPRAWSEHAYGEAIDVNPLENPYVFEGSVMPPGGRRFLDRADVRPGMAVPGGELVAAFAAAGWQWGARWAGSPDYQHFSVNGR